MAGRNRAWTQIVPPQDVLDNQAIHTEKWTLYGLGNAMTDSDSILKWLAAHRLIKNSLQCVPCNEEYMYSLNVYNDGVTPNSADCNYIISCVLSIYNL
jgi:hypothetical protein